MRVAIVDADIVAYQAAASSEQAFNWGDGLWTLHSFEQDAITHFESILKKLKEKIDASKLVLAFSDSGNWRKDVLPTYKANRKDVRKPLLLGYIRRYAMEKYDCRTIKGLEGDDIIGLIVTGKLGSIYIACSIDKDLKTIPGSHYNFSTDEFFEISQEEADYWHLIQTLTGDQTDGYAGCPGIGPKTAEKILSDGGGWAAVVKAYEKAGFGEEEALTQARVARILRSGEYNFETNQVKLWTPT